MPRCALRPDAADRNPLPGQPLVRIVGPQGQPILGARGEHAVRLGDAAGHQVVDHHAEIAFGAVENDLGRRRRPRSRVEPRHQALRRGLLVAGGAVDLAGQEKPRQTLGLQASASSSRGSTWSYSIA